MTFKETIVRRDVTSQHAVQLFDNLETRGEAVADFLNDGYNAGDNLLVVITQEHWGHVASRLRAAGFPLPAAVDTGRLTVRDASIAVGQLMRKGRPDPALFEEAFGALVRTLAAAKRPLRIYGELVDLLAADGDFRSAQLVEELWNGLSGQQPFTLFCGYGAVNFGDPRSTESLRSICRAHSLVRSNPRDLLGSFLLNAASAHPFAAGK